MKSSRIGTTVSVQSVGLAVALSVLVAAVAAAPTHGFTLAQQRAVAVFTIALLLWLTKPVPYTVSSLVSVTLLFALGVVESFGAATTGYASTLVFFLLSLLLLGNAIASVGLDRQLARRLLSAESTPNRAVRSIAGGVFGLALVMPSAMARAVTLVPIVEQLRESFGLTRGSGFDRASFLLLGHVNPIASMALLTGGGMPLVTSEIIATSVQSLTWLRWAVLMVPPTALLYALATVSAVFLTDVDGTRTVGRTGDGDGGVGSESGRPNGGRAIAGFEGSASLTRDQRIVGVVMLGAIGSWIAGSFLGVPTVLPAVGAVAVLAAPGVGVVTADDVADVNWGIIFLIGAMLSILDALAATRALDAVVAALTPVVPFSALAHWQVIAVLLLLSVAIRVPFSTASAAIVVALPIVLEFGSAFGVDRLFLSLSVLLVVGSTTLFPFNTTAVLVSMDRGPLSHVDVAGFGLVMMVLSFVVVVVSWLWYWPLVA
ncbi:SLC13 family permease [Halobellus sp. Atlit-31R]|nr:SLC13 family permease [Halobellus sp. Atlit-31R]